MSPSKLFKISSPDGSPARKVYCPADEIDRQLQAGETAEEVDPLVDGFGMVLDMTDGNGA